MAGFLRTCRTFALYLTREDCEQSLKQFGFSAGVDIMAI